MRIIKLKQVLEVATNVAVLVAAIAIIALLAHSYFATPAKRAAAKLQPGATIGEVKDLDFGAAPRTLLLVMSTGCRYCIQSVPFYQTLASMRGNLAGRTRILAVFPEDEANVKTFLQKSQLELEFRPNVDLGKLSVSATPTLILVDSSKNILNSWVGSLAKEQQAEVVKNIGEGDAPASVAQPKVESSISLFDEQSQSVTIVPENSEKNDLLRSINFFGVDQQGDIFLVNGNRLLKYGNKGEFLAEAPLPDQFHGTFCVDHAGTSYLPSKANLVTYDVNLKQRRTIPLPSILAAGNVVLKMEANGADDALYLQIYQPEPLSQVLYKVDMLSLRVTRVFTLEKPVKFSPDLTPGAFDFAVGPRHIYVSDIYEYKILSYSLATGKYEGTFSHPFSPIPISESDGELKVRRMRVGGLTGQAEYLKNYPPILHLNIANNGALVVWTSQRNGENRQAVDVYDEDFKLVGTDIKYAHPTISSYVFMNGNVYAPDFGFGKNESARDLSPLEIPSLPLALKVFRDNLISEAMESRPNTSKESRGGK